MAELVRSLREGLQAERARIVEAFRAGGSVDALLLALRRNVDRAVIAAAQALELPHDSAVIAVGGYGRGELFPYSDVDLLLLFDTPIDDALHRRISDFLGVCWDMGLEIGHSVRTVEECRSEEHTSELQSH